MIEHLIRKFELHFPTLASDCAKYIERDFDQLIVKLKDGSSYLYDDMENGIRKLPANSNDMTEHEFQYEFADQLKRLMKRRGINQEELSARTGLSQPTISNYLTCRRTPNFYVVDKLAKVLHCSIDDLTYKD